MPEPTIENDTDDVVNIPFATYMERRIPVIDRDLLLLKSKIVELEKERSSIEDFARLNKIYRTGSAKSHRARAEEDERGNSQIPEQEAEDHNGERAQAECEAQSSRRSVRGKISIKDAIMMVLNENRDGLAARDINPLVDEILGKPIKPSSLWPQLTRLKDVERIIVNEGGVWKKSI